MLMLEIPLAANAQRPTPNAERPMSNVQLKGERRLRVKLRWASSPEMAEVLLA